MRRLRVVLGFVAAQVVTMAAPGSVEATPILPHDPWRLCPEAIAGQEQVQGIPKHLLSAIALAESGRKHPALGKAMPWPWTVMAEGKGRYLPSKAAAVNEVRQLQARGIRNIDVGCMQVNLYHHPEAFIGLEHAFDPNSNVAYAGQFLRGLFDATGSWQEAAGLYHSATPEHKVPYRQRVVKIWNDQQRLEMLGGSTFGAGALTAGLAGSGATAARVRSPAMMMSLAERRLAQTPRFVRQGTDTLPTYDAPPSQSRSFAGGTQRPVRTLDEEAAFAARRAQYLQELRQAVAEVKRSYAVQVARGDPRMPLAPTNIR